MSAVSSALSASTSPAALAWSFVSFVCAAATRAAWRGGVDGLRLLGRGQAVLGGGDGDVRLVSDACCWAAVAPVGCTASASLVCAEARFIWSRVTAACSVWFWTLARTCPVVTRWPTLTSISLTIPLFWKLTASCVAGLTFPVALTLDNTVPRCTVAVVVGAFAAAGGPTAT